MTRGVRCRGCLDLYVRRSSLGISLARFIWVWVLSGSYCRFVRWLLRLLRWSSSVSGVEQMRRTRRAWLYGMLFSVCGGCEDVGRRYEWVSVGLVYSSVCSLLSTILRRVSRKGISSEDDSSVNLMVGWMVLIWV